MLTLDAELIGMPESSTIGFNSTLPWLAITTNADQIAFDVLSDLITDYAYKAQIAVASAIPFAWQLRSRLNTV
ncbi:MAG TPA: hypothetical protein VNX46_01510 [Candidatus Acidoferrum sp.]|jgi:hypothetical protein|nr:hypothetical protein [Candidatus Acidoferrum sp.]